MNPGQAAEKLKHLLGPYGCQSSKLEWDDLTAVAKLAFDVPGRTISDVATNASRLSAKERSARVKEAILKHWPEPTVLWPAKAPVRKWIGKIL